MEKIIIIGAGSAGLAIAGRLRRLGIEFEILDKSQLIANSWHGHYDRLHLHTVNEFSHLPHLKFPSNYPRYLSRLQLVEYYQNYAEKFNIKSRFGHELTNLEKLDGHWLLSFKNAETKLAKYVVIATGANRTMNIPEWPGQSLFSGKISHSRFYKNNLPFKDKKVLVVGMGNTGAELALDLCDTASKTYLSVRSPIAVVPRDLNGRPTQITAKQLAKLPWGIGDWLGSQIRKVYYGDLSKYGLEIAKMHPAKMLRETGKTPVIDIGTIQAIKEGKIKIVPDLKQLTKSGVLFLDGKEIPIDEVILATGYKANIAEFIPNLEDQLDPRGLPKSVIAEGKWEGLYFLGYDNYKLGGLLGTIYKDSKTIAEDVFSKMKDR